MSRVVFLLEERSMKALLEGLLPRLFPGLSFICVPHEGKQDLEKSIPRKLRAWREPGARFVIVRDNDGGDCRALKERLSRLCADSGRPDARVRIACQELEAWYLGESSALAKAFDNPGLSGIEKKARYRDPDAIHTPSRELAKLIPEFQKVSGARRLARHLTRNGNRSRSFQIFMAGVEHEFARIKSQGL
ncbi:conserved hypothetical protein [Candidatus Desulfarcum epimagneticum]|uniref:Cytoplasmic protein n=1 Tax=uncultured Desulfobacteraceae bacterium TaxID=218296 RepID=A0A484HHX7_9BACT|nr:conserved hypothetical protein [uncultured Desulfobacteraceae bacterium]